ncbi:hypothetical protein ACMATS_05790 [Streptoverticillium reticulum]|uniref:hypothetical protein n=1 Tax=Streptoverticillium reticulum TaxID=1433415 RepID=UPI0039BEE21F
MKVPSGRHFTGNTTGQVIDAIRALGSDIVFQPGAEPTDKDLPRLLGYLAASIDRALLLHVQPENMDDFLRSYGEAVCEPQPDGTMVLGTQWMGLVTVRTIRLRSEVEAFAGASPFTRCVVHALGAAGGALSLIGQARAIVDDATVKESLKATKRALQQARQAYEDAVRMLKRMGADL